ncbi:MAG: exodeoxyribonuclease-1 [Lentisphaeria bacterium]|jgi:exodeoxyribonuclease-1
MATFYWHDYETWGAVPSVDRPSQFAGVRTDENLNVIGKPLVIYCRPTEDVWPTPEACLITGITPQTAQREGLPEREFIQTIHRELAHPGTCGVGYNSIRFDDEITRYTLFRNFHDPYEREWRNGNSRWDIIDMVRLVYALRPEGIEWPMIDGKPSFKLERLTAANGISHESAHDAYSDVDATIKLARLIRRKQPTLYDYVVRNKSKAAVGKLIDLQQRKPLLHISSRFPASRGCAGLVVPLAMHPVNKNAVIVFDLSVDPSPLRGISSEALHSRVFTAERDLPEGEHRLPLKLVHLNKCPILATPKLVDGAAEERLGINKAQCEKHWQMIKAMDISTTLRDLYLRDNFTPSDDPESRLYDGFIKDADKKLMGEVRAMPVDALASTTVIFNDERLNEILYRYRCRNFPETLSADECEQWREFVWQRLLNGAKNRLSLTQLEEKINQLLKAYSGDAKKSEVLHQLRTYANQIINKYQPAS